MHNQLVLDIKFFPELSLPDDQQIVTTRNTKFLNNTREKYKNNFKSDAIKQWINLSSEITNSSTKKLFSYKLLNFLITNNDTNYVIEEDKCNLSCIDAVVESCSYD